MTYDTGLGLPDVYDSYHEIFTNSTPNTSARIFSIQDVRAPCPGNYCSNQNYVPTTFTFTYSTSDRQNNVTPHLTAIANSIGTSETYSFTYTSAALNPPFGGDSRYAGATTDHLRR